MPPFHQGLGDPARQLLAHGKHRLGQLLQAGGFGRREYGRNRPSSRYQEGGDPGSSPQHFLICLRSNTRVEALYRSYLVWVDVFTFKNIDEMNREEKTTPKPIMISVVAKNPHS